MEGSSRIGGGGLTSRDSGWLCTREQRRTRKGAAALQLPVKERGGAWAGWDSEQAGSHGNISCHSKTGDAHLPPVSRRSPREDRWGKVGHCSHLPALKGLSLLRMDLPPHH